MKTFLWQFDLSKTCMAIVLVNLSVLSLVSVRADTAAYWRHEGTSGQFVAGGPDSVLDSSGNNNHMQTFSAAAAPFTAATYTSLVSPLALQSGLPNTTSLDFGPNPSIGNDDGGGKNDDNYTQDKDIQTQLFTAMTVELAFNMNAIDGYQNLFGRDGKPLGDDPGEEDEGVAPLQIKIRGDDFPDAIPNQLFVEWIDGDGDIHFLSGGETIVAGEWKHIAFTLTATSAELWVAGETGDYVLKDAISGEDFAGALGPGEVMIFDPTPFTIGRGMFNNGVTDWSDALIDEVRVSNTALLPNEFLFVTVPGADGDFDEDGDVDGRDFLAWQRGESPSPLSAGDLEAWQDAYGAGGLSTVSVPEPTAALLISGLLGVVMSTRRGCRGI
jgi:hypothetical protein